MTRYSVTVYNSRRSRMTLFSAFLLSASSRQSNGNFFDSIFFFSSRGRHTRSTRDWSSDVCSSDLVIRNALLLYPSRSEIRMGKALRDGYRSKAFLMTKIDGRSKREAARQLDESLRRLQTDRIDLVQHHEVIRFDDPHRIFDEKEGANAALLEAKRAGKLRYIGFTGHKDPRIHLHTLEVARDHGFTFDTVQMPLNVMDAHYRSFEQLV